MYVRWRKDKLKSGDVSLRADVLRAYRNPMSGKPTSELVGYLGSIRRSELLNPAKREMFWQEVEGKLRQLPLSKDEASKIKRSIRRTVPRHAPTSALVMTYSKPSVPPEPSIDFTPRAITTGGAGDYTGE
jgi:hypothetical protein